MSAPDRIVLVTSSPRLPAGVLSWPAWAALRTGPVLADDTEQARAVAAAGIAVGALPAAADARARAEALREVARTSGAAVWLAGPDGDPQFVTALRDLPPDEVDVQIVVGSQDPPGARLLDLVAAMDRLRRECPWDREQTHASLRPYLIEEAYEAHDAIESGDEQALREELGDVLLQVVFHARLGEEAAEPWSIDEIAGTLIDKLVRRHPHVFAGLEVSGADEVTTNWDAIKRSEKGRTSALDGVPLGLPALLLAHTFQRKAAKAGVPPELMAGGPGIGGRLFDDVRSARADDVDAEADLRAVTLAFGERLRVAEKAARAEGADPADLDAAAWRRYWPAG